MKLSEYVEVHFLDGPEARTVKLLHTSEFNRPYLIVRIPIPGTVKLNPEDQPSALRKVSLEAIEWEYSIYYISPPFGSKFSRAIAFLRGPIE